MENKDSGNKGSTDVLMVEKAPASKSPVSPDLSAEISLTVERLKGEKVKCRRIFGDNYRCNWLTVEEDLAGGGRSMALDSYRIRASKFLRVTKAGEQLVIEDVTAGAN